MSFALVAGACCLVKFTYATADSSGPKLNITMNINSTGAKYWLNSYISASGATSGIILMYTGSSYSNTTVYNANQYSDYQD